MKNTNTNTSLAQRVGRAAGTGLMKIGQFIQKHSGTLACCLMVCLMIGKVVCATEGGDEDKAETMWTTVTDLVAKWVTRLGGVVIFVGGIMFALGWKSDDADQKSRGIQTMIAGAMVAAIAGITGTFFT